MNMRTPHYFSTIPMGEVLTETDLEHYLDKNEIYDLTKGQNNTVRRITWANLSKREIVERDIEEIDEMILEEEEDVDEDRQKNIGILKEKIGIMSLKDRFESTLNELAFDSDSDEE